MYELKITRKIIYRQIFLDYVKDAAYGFSLEAIIQFVLCVLIKKNKLNAFSYGRRQKNVN